ncbi:Molybdopterin biosynthesis MoaE [Mrakia frigida]|uniref:molybdopterin synthase catalytic subunit n=1 Tax=Mrakia frigida TaxID=29902 RepID=UPI003FCBF8E4
MLSSIAFDPPPPPPAPEPEIYTSTTPEGDVATITSETLDEAAILNSVKDVKAGGICVFVGTTRDTFGDKPVSHLSYTSYSPLALKTILSILTRTRSLHPTLLHLSCHHRLGTVDPGQTSIVIAVSSPHRREAFEACEWVLEEVKRKVQVWKREVYGTGEVLDQAQGGGGEAGGVHPEVSLTIHDGISSIASSLLTVQTS